MKTKRKFIYYEVVLRNIREVQDRYSYSSEELVDCTNAFCELLQTERDTGYKTYNYPTWVTLYRVDVNGKESISTIIMESKLLREKRRM